VIRAVERDAAIERRTRSVVLEMTAGGVFVVPMIGTAVAVQRI